jgi:hypothetical protein
MIAHFAQSSARNDSVEAAGPMHAIMNALRFPRRLDGIELALVEFPLHMIPFKSDPEGRAALPLGVVQLFVENPPAHLHALPEAVAPRIEAAFAEGRSVALNSQATRLATLAAGRLFHEGDGGVGLAFRFRSEGGEAEIRLSSRSSTLRLPLPRASTAEPIVGRVVLPILESGPGSAEVLMEALGEKDAKLALLEVAVVVEGISPQASALPAFETARQGEGWTMTLRFEQPLVIGRHAMVLLEPGTFDAGTSLEEVLLEGTEESPPRRFTMEVDQAPAALLLRPGPLGEAGLTRIQIRGSGTPPASVQGRWLGAP